MLARRNMGRIEACCRPTIQQPESGDLNNDVVLKVWMADAEATKSGILRDQ